MAHVAKKQENRAKKSLSPSANSQRDLAAVHKVSLRTVQKWLEDPRWKDAGFSTRAPWSIKEIARQREWRREVLQENRSADQSAISNEKDKSERGSLGRARQIATTKKLVAQEELIRAELAIKNRDFVRRVEAEEAGAAKWRVVKQSLIQLPKALRQMLADSNGDPRRCEEILESALRALCAEFGK